MVEVTEGDFLFKVKGIEIESFADNKDDIGVDIVVDVPISLGRFTAPLPRASPAPEILLDRQISCHKCGVQDLP
jgi:hypothetical protein